jgi:hypothetical protein
MEPYPLPFNPDLPPDHTIILVPDEGCYHMYQWQTLPREAGDYIEVGGTWIYGRIPHDPSKLYVDIPLRGGPSDA